jgi:hypothetical protein
MHILERYSLSCGLKIGKPFTVDHCFPTKSNSYITIHNSKKFDSRDYEYWEDVVEMLKPALSKEFISIVQVGGVEDKRIEGVDEFYAGKTTIRQTSGIVKNSRLHVGVDSLPVHLASAFGVPLVALYPNMYSSNSRPYWSDENDVVCIEPDRGNLRPSFSANENPKTINFIKPETIANHVLEKLGLEDRVMEKTLHIGSQYRNLSLEIVPDFRIPSSSYPNSNLNVRMDLHFNENNLMEALTGRLCNIESGRPINPNLLRKFSKSISTVFFEISNDFTEEYLKEVRKIGINFVLWTSEPDKEKVSFLRTKFFDFEIQNFQEKSRENSEVIIDDIKDILYKSNKFIISKGKLYPSEQRYLDNQPCEDFFDNVSEFKDSKTFWEDVEYFRIYRKT